MTPEQIADREHRRLNALARPAGEFDAARYFRGPATLGFYNVRAPIVRQMGRACAAAHPEWGLDDAVRFAERLMPDAHLEAKALAIETLARFRRQFTPRLLGVCKRWLRRNDCDNWATTDLLCGRVLGPLLVRYPELIAAMHVWSRDANLWLRRAAIVSLLAPLRTGAAVDDIYAIAGRLHASDEDLIAKAVGWVLRSAGRKDPVRLETYLRRHGAAIPRTTVRYAIERFPAAKRAELLRATRATRAGNTAVARRPGASKAKRTRPAGSFRR